LFKLAKGEILAREIDQRVNSQNGNDTHYNAPGGLFRPRKRKTQVRQPVSYSRSVLLRNLHFPFKFAGDLDRPVNLGSVESIKVPA
jgi:hypothetical protein